MGVSLMTALALQGSKPIVSIQGPNNKGFFSGIIGHNEGNGNYRLDITTDFCFKTKTEAWKETRKIVKQIKDIDLKKILGSKK